MKIILNNREEILETNEERLNIDQLLKLKKFSFTRLIVKINDQFVPKDKYRSTYFRANERVDVIHMISGG